ncbi:hypothetical protein J7T55_010402 [Diaporthe amygdali]|uniref:uncharacterized protein n=1 Tax=Phomopsis amygdali TaxID=1214568 RepID=UPI0022FDE384|nr:uncharacterized protein J7T55_010402 [Diaporthe amygdali]KAJ0115579.1 hypothetical protein J7T55_010402 [Diaporthe amygdali]
MEKLKAVLSSALAACQIPARLSKASMGEVQRQQQEHNGSYQADSKLMNLPLELLDLIYAQLEPSGKIACSLACIGLYDNYFESAWDARAYSSPTAKRDVISVLEKDVAHHEFFCPFCDRFRGFRPRGKAKPRQKVVCCPSPRLAMNSYQGPEISFPLGRLVLNRHLYGADCGLPLGCLEIDDLPIRVTGTGGIPLTWRQTWRARIIENELFLRCTHLLTQEENMTAEALRAAVEGGSSYFFCTHRWTSRTSDNPMFYRGKIPLHGRISEGQLTACQKAASWCSKCLTDLNTTIEWRPCLEADAGGKVGVSGSGKGRWTIRVESYHQLGSFRRAVDWKYQAACSTTPWYTANELFMSAQYAQGLDQNPPGSVMMSWQSGTLEFPRHSALIARENYTCGPFLNDDTSTAMAAVQNNLPSRTRSARIAGLNSTRTLTSAAAAAAPSRHHATLPSSTSNVSLFLTNLHLLDLDLLPDWPGLNPSTFTNKDASQGQKKRVQCVEWALYQLFKLWDPEEARNKLQPFFPPLEQVQSVNLRAALLRCLEQAKKNGVLGRDIVLRKTMLDECKGERMEEVLAVFSSAVLKKVITEEQLNSKAHSAIAQTLALENRGYTGERVDLSSLIIAHKVSLRKKLDQKGAFRAQYNDFAKLLDSKEHGISRRREQTKSVALQSKIPRLSDASKQDLRRAVRNNWSGNERWIETLLYGDAKSQKDGVLTAPFDRVWRRVRSNRLDELEDTSGGLLEQLGSRVRTQQARLDKWQSFRNEMFSDVVDQPQQKGTARVGRQKGIDLGFGAHEGLHLGRMSPRKLTSSKTSHLNEEYRALIDGLQTELQSLSQNQAAPFFGQLKGREQPLKSSVQSSSSEKPVDEPVSELSELEEELAKTSLPLRSKPSEHLSRLDADQAMESIIAPKPSQRAPRARLPQPLKTMHAFRPTNVPTEISPTDTSIPTSRSDSKTASPQRSPAREHKDLSRSPTRFHRHSPSPSPSRSHARGSRDMTQSPEEMPPSPTQQQADQILASMNAASPSPVKQPRPRHTLSLAERTRLSMARGSSADLDDEDEVALSSPSRHRRRNTSSRSPTKSSKPATPTTIKENHSAGDEADAEQGKEDDIVARTRKSMANFEATQQRVRLERQRSAKREARKQTLSNKSGEIARQPYFPPDTVDEEAAGAGGDDSTAMLEELIAREAQMGEGAADYDSVFKSRPRIKASPPGTPVRDRFGFE